MSAIRLQAIVQEADIPYIERFLKGIATNINFEEDSSSLISSPPPQ